MTQTTITDTLKSTDIDSFMPHPLVRGSLMQTVLSARMPSSFKRLRAREQPFLVDGGLDYTGHDSARAVRLLAYYSPADSGGVGDEHAPTRGLVLMLHGWRGCSHSPYNLIVTDALVRQGFDVVRLNLRDHGPDIHYPSHELNKGAFLGTLIDEVVAATQRIGEMAGARPFYIVGPSLGGNFALRLAIKHNDKPIPNLGHVVAISPAVSPASATKALDSIYIYRRYFRNLWLASLQAKIAAYPDSYRYVREIERFRTVWDMTEWSIPQMTQYEGADEYFSSYSVRSKEIRKVAVQTTIVTATDDPVIPVADIEALPETAYVKTHILAHGGHVGFIDLQPTNLRRPIKHCLPGMILSILGS